MNILRGLTVLLFVGSDSLKSGFAEVPPAQAPIGRVSDCSLIARFSLNNE